jgi:hypothetical protein
VRQFVDHLEPGLILRCALAVGIRTGQMLLRDDLDFPSMIGHGRD